MPGSRRARKSCLLATSSKIYKDTIEGKDVEFKLLVKRRPELSGEHVKRAYAYFDQQGYGVSLSLDAAGGKIFGDLTQSLAPSRVKLPSCLMGKSKARRASMSRFMAAMR